MDDTARTYAPPRWATALHRIAERAIRPMAKGRVPLHAAIDAHKASTGLFVLLLMAMYDTFTNAAWVYLALHGAYGIAWLIKDRTFPDTRWHRAVSLLGATGALLFLSLYWVAPAILVLGTAGTVDMGGWRPAGPEQRAAAIFLYALGLVLMIGSDLQKNVTLARGPGLITTGFFRRVRHPNYLGEILIYGSFALVVNHWLPWAILVAVWLLFFLPSMLVIEGRLSRHPEFEAWRERTGFLLPRFW